VLTGLGAIFVVTQSSGFDCLRKGSKQCTGSAGNLLAILPVGPLAGLALIALAGITTIVRNRYLRSLENEIRAELGLQDDFPLDVVEHSAELADKSYALRWTNLAREINTTGRGVAVYRLLVHALFVGIAIIYVALLVYIARHVGMWPRAFMAVGYSFGAALLVGALCVAWFGEDALWDGVTVRYVLRLNPDAEEVLRQRQEDDVRPGRAYSGLRRDRLVSYLVFPRTWALVFRLALIFGIAAILFWGHAPAHADLWHATLVIVANCLFFDLGMYAARDQWADIRRDEHLPFWITRSAQRSNIYTSAFVMVVRVFVTFALLMILADEEIDWAIAIGVALLMATIGDSIVEWREAHRRATAATRISEVLLRSLAFAARAVAAWQICELAGASVPSADWMAAVALTASAGMAWAFGQQLNYREIDSTGHVESEFGFVRWIRETMDDLADELQDGVSLGMRVLFRRAFEDEEEGDESPALIGSDGSGRARPPEPPEAAEAPA
jgi:hypothetical protein